MVMSDRVSFIVMQYHVPHSMTLIDALAHLSPNSSRTTLRSWLKTERVAVDGAISKIANTPLEAGQLVEVNAKRNVIEGGIELLYADDDLIVINKPAGLLSVKTNFDTENTAHAILKRHFRPKKVHVVHRLDQETSGVMLFALNEKSLDELKRIFEKHDIDRNYCAIVEGQMKKGRGTWSSYLYEDNNYNVHETNDPRRGRLSVTHYTVVARSKKHTWLDLKLETGRKNQIRVHCQSAGHPVSGDTKYGAGDTPAKRLCLHAYRLGFRHPTTGKPMTFEVPAPQAFYRIVNIRGTAANETQ